MSSQIYQKLLIDGLMICCSKHFNFHYGLNEAACKLVENYFMGRHQRVQLGCVKRRLVEIA